MLLPAQSFFLLFESNLSILPLEVVVERDDVTFVVKYDMELHLPGIGSEVIDNFVIKNLKGLLYDWQPGSVDTQVLHHHMVRHQVISDAKVPVAVLEQVFARLGGQALLCDRTVFNIFHLSTVDSEHYFALLNENDFDVDVAAVSVRDAVS